MDEGTAAVLAAQGKYLATKFGHEVGYECVQIMGGRGVLNEPGSNNIVERSQTMSNVIEVLGGHRNIQLLIAEMGLKATTQMAIARNIKKAKKQHKATQAELLNLYLQRGHALLDSDKKQFISESTLNKLSMAVSKIEAGIEENNTIEVEAYGRAIPRILGTAEKEIYKATK